jgi:hypothetical protein
MSRAEAVALLPGWSHSARARAAQKWALALDLVLLELPLAARINYWSPISRTRTEEETV